jgi:hypothetical protein
MYVGFKSIGNTLVRERCQTSRIDRAVGRGRIRCGWSWRCNLWHPPLAGVEA